MRDASWVRALAPAKVNLVLDVLGRRDDGFHELETVMLALDLHDVVRARVVPKFERGLALAERIALEVRGPAATPDVPSDASNLAARGAALALERAADPSLGVELVVEKHIPSRAGLGGGSADAAAAFLATCAAIGSDAAGPSQTSAAHEREKSVTNALASLGSDCAFFHGARSTGAAYCTGRGAQVTPISSPSSDWWIAVITPESACPTKDVYAAWGMSLRPPQPLSTFQLELATAPATGVRGLLHNALEPAAVAAVPSLSSWREALNASGASHFLLAGSGSSYFGLFDSREQALRGLAEVQSELERRNLQHRGSWITRPAGHGAVVT
ncbi:MAG: hypothetical protein GY711_24390 [bacterium]|nr:hypothetical protein [bacterium]